MKKLIIFFAIILVIVFVVLLNYSSYKIEHAATLQENFIYEQYTNKEIYGVDVATIINKSVDSNTRNKIAKTENNMFITNDENSVEVEIYIKDNETTYKMETIYNKGTEQFVIYYGNIKFKCSKVEYHKKTDKIKYMLFEQI